MPCLVLICHVIPFDLYSVSDSDSVISHNLIPFELTKYVETTILIYRMFCWTLYTKSNEKLCNFVASVYPTKAVEKHGMTFEIICPDCFCVRELKFKK